jgi:hypothetical protein
MSLSSTNTTWLHGSSYAEDRDYEIKIFEYDNLFYHPSDPSYLDIYPDSIGHPTIGYGYDLFENIGTVATDLPLYLAGGTQISAYQMEVLRAYEAGRKVNYPGGALDGQIPNQATFETAWSNIVLASEAHATALLDAKLAQCHSGQRTISTNIG